MHFKNKEIQLQYQGYLQTNTLWTNTLGKLTQFTDYQYNYTILFKLKIDNNPRLG
mgnify:CR=1 FL=1